MNQLSTACLYLIAIGTSVNMLSFACRLHADIIAHHLKHPFGILTGIGCQFLVMPSVSTTVVSVEIRDTVYVVTNRVGKRRLDDV